MKVTDKTRKIIIFGTIIAVGISIFLVGYFSVYDDKNGIVSQMKCTIHYHINNNSPFAKSVDTSVFLIPNSTFYINNKPQQQAIINDNTPSGCELVIDEGGNLKLNLKTILQAMSESHYTFDFHIKIQGGRIAVPVQGSFSNYNQSSAEFSLYLGSEEYIESNDPDIAARAILLNNSNPWVVVENVISFVASHLTYLDELHIPGAASAMSSGTGVCFDYACLMTALLRDCGIPARYAEGLVLPDSVSDAEIIEFRRGNGIISANSSRHAWVEYYLPQVGWVASDPTWYDGTNGAKYLHGLDVLHLTIFRGSPSVPMDSIINDPSITTKMVYEFNEITGNDVYSYKLNSYLLVGLIIAISGVILFEIRASFKLTTRKNTSTS